MVGEVTFAVLGVLFLIADIRTFASTFQLTFYGQPNSTLGIMATAAFGTAFLAPLLGWRLGPRGSVAVSGAILGLATLLATLSPSNVPDLALSVVGLAAGTWWLGLLHSSRPPERPSPLPIAIPIAFAVDVALRAAFHSVPVVDVTPTVAAPLALVAALVFFASGVAALGRERSWTRPGLPGSIALLALPAVFLVAETGGTNGSQVALGWLVFVGTTFGFYAFWAYVPAVYAAVALVVVAGLIVPAASLPPWRMLAIALVPLVVGVPLAALLLTPTPGASEEPRNTFRVMTFNIHQGFNTVQSPSLDQIVEVIAHESPDVLLLQEVVRGWMIDEQHDALGVLAERLGMPYVFAPNIGDLYGNAILSRFPMTDVKRVHFAPQPSLRHQPRGAVGVRIGDVLIINTHLDDIADSSAIRQEQVRTILREWDGERVAIIAGDMNAEPGSLEMALLSEAGDGDLSGPARRTTMDEPPKRRIDYI